MELRTQLKILIAITTIFSAMNLGVFPPVLGKSGGGKKIVHHKSLAAMLMAQSLNFFRQVKDELEEPPVRTEQVIFDKTENSFTPTPSLSSSSSSLLSNKVINLPFVAFKAFVTIAKSIVLKLILAVAYSAALSYMQKKSEENWRNYNNNYTNYDDLPLSKWTNMSSSFWPTVAEPRGFLDADQCFERVYCFALTSIKWTTIFDMFSLKRYLFVPTLYRPPPPPRRQVMTSRLLSWNIDLKNCYQYHCSPVRFLFRLFIYVVDWNTLLKT